MSGLKKKSGMFYRLFWALVLLYKFIFPHTYMIPLISVTVREKKNTTVIYSVPQSPQKHHFLTSLFFNNTLLNPELPNTENKRKKTIMIWVLWAAVSCRTPSSNTDASISGAGGPDTSSSIYLFWAVWWTRLRRQQVLELERSLEKLQKHAPVSTEPGWVWSSLVGFGQTAASPTIITGCSFKEGHLNILSRKCGWQIPDQPQ